MSDYMLDMPIVYAGRPYMVRPGSRRAKYLERAAMHWDMRDSVSYTHLTLPTIVGV